MPVAAGLYYFAHEADNFSRPPLILIHGAGGDHLYWPPQVRRMHNQRVFAVDLPGHGKSESVGHQTVEQYAGEVLEFIKALNLNVAILVGHSLGSAVAMRVAIDSPRRVLGLGLIGGGARLRVAPAILRGVSDSSTFADAIQRINELSFAPQTSQRLKELGVQRLSQTRPTVLYGDLLACEAFDVTDQLANISTPTLVICGAEDKMTPLKHSEFLRDIMPSARLEVLPNAGHMAMLEQPNLTAELLAEFVNSVHYRPGQ